MAKSSLLGLAALLPLFTQAAASPTTYTLQDSYTPTNFLSSFDFFTSPDPTHGFVSYVSGPDASSAGLATVDATKNQVRLGVDTKSTIDNATVSSYNGGDYSVGGRKAVRLQSKKLYTTMLMVADVEHMPVGCGTWPALWSWGTASWPANGEIDVIEGANSQSTNAMTLHTSPGCTMTNTGQASGTNWYSGSGDCNAGNGNTGCSQRGTSTSNFGAGFNSAQGGVYAMEWTDEAISIWFWSRSSIPSAIKRSSSSSSSSSSTIDPSSFGTPIAKFTGGGGCDISQHFNGHAITINTALCGDWAGQAWESDSTCKAKAATCAEYVANNPEAFKDAYWLFNSIKVYTMGSSNPSRPNGEKRGISAMAHGAVHDVEGAWNNVKSQESAADKGKFLTGTGSSNATDRTTSFYNDTSSSSSSMPFDDMPGDSVPDPMAPVGSGTPIIAPGAASLASVSMPPYQLNTTRLAGASTATIKAKRQGKVSREAGHTTESKRATFPVLSLPQTDLSNILVHTEKRTGNGDIGYAEGSQCFACESSREGVCELRRGADGRLPKMFVA